VWLLRRTLLENGRTKRHAVLSNPAIHLFIGIQVLVVSIPGAFTVSFYWLVQLLIDVTNRERGT
jgi:hypothetical protein